MKKLLITLALILITIAVKAQYCPDDNHPHMIDLGLPSGTLWSCCNVDAKTPTEYGGYYAWGELSEKRKYSWTTYIYCDGTRESCYNMDNNISSTQYDVAYLKWGDNWEMPSLEQYSELIVNCSYMWLVDFNGVKGARFTGPNGESIFMPAAGTITDSEIVSDGTGCLYWSSTQNTDYGAGILVAGKGINNRYLNSDYYRCSGLSVRPVVRRTSFSPLELSSYKITFSVGEEETVRVISGNGNYTVESSDESVASVTISYKSITVTAVSAGTAVITVKDTKSGQIANIEVEVFINQEATLCPDDNHPHMIDLGLPSGTLWSCCNVDTDHPEKQRPTNYGGWYAWGETETKKIYDIYSYRLFDSTTRGYLDIESDIAGTEYDAAYVNWSNNWQMPTKEQTVELFSNCDYEWKVVDGIKGAKYISKLNGACIFLPAAGLRYESNFDYVGTYGYYWLSTSIPASAYTVYSINFDSKGNRVSTGSGRYGQSIRPVNVISNNINSIETASGIYNPSIYNILGVKVGDNINGLNTLSPGIYIVNGKKFIVK